MSARAEFSRGESEGVRDFRQSRSGDFAAAVLISAPFASWLVHKSALYGLPTILALVVGLAWCGRDSDGAC